MTNEQINMNESIEKPIKYYDGGPAFPSDKACESFQCRKPSNGMSLRDWFAGQALAGLLAGGPAGDEFGVNHFAKAAFYQADAMLAERSRKEARND